MPGLKANPAGWTVIWVCVSNGLATGGVGAAAGCGRMGGWPGAVGKTPGVWRGGRGWTAACSGWAGCTGAWMAVFSTAAATKQRDGESVSWGRDGDTEETPSVPLTAHCPFPKGTESPGDSSPHARVIAEKGPPSSRVTGRAEPLCCSRTHPARLSNPNQVLLPTQRVRGTSAVLSSPLSVNHSWDRILPSRELKRQRFPLTGNGTNPALGSAGEAPIFLLSRPQVSPLAEPHLLQGGAIPRAPNLTWTSHPIPVRCLPPSRRPHPALAFSHAPSTFCTGGAANKSPE